LPEASNGGSWPTGASHYHRKLGANRQRILATQESFKSKAPGGCVDFIGIDRVVADVFAYVVET
jgi:hypothetical protein